MTSAQKKVIIDDFGGVCFLDYKFITRNVTLEILDSHVCFEFHKLCLGTFYS